jgi:hypothetical protein
MLLFTVEPRFTADSRLRADFPYAASQALIAIPFDISCVRRFLAPPRVCVRYFGSAKKLLQTLVTAPKSRLLIHRRKRVEASVFSALPPAEKAAFLPGVFSALLPAEKAPFLPAISGSKAASQTWNCFIR